VKDLVRRMYHLPKQPNELLAVGFDAGFDILYTVAARCEVYRLLVADLINILATSI
jgi:hypothetical protein